MLDEDPGWPVSWKSLAWMLVPQYGLRRQVQRIDGGADGLLVLRQVFMSFCFSLVAFGVVLAVIHQGARAPDDPPTTFAIALLGLGAAGVLIGMKIEKPLDCVDDVALAGSYRTRFFLRMAFANAAALSGFVGYFLASAWWAYPIGAAVAVLGFLRAAPSARNLARDQDALSTRGCSPALVRALRSPKAPA